MEVLGQVSRLLNCKNGKGILTWKATWTTSRSSDSGAWTSRKFCTPYSVYTLTSILND